MSIFGFKPTDGVMAKIIDKYCRLWLASKPKLGRWAWCKFCEKHVKPEVGSDFSLIVCSCCQAGLVPMREVCEAGSLAAWAAALRHNFNLQHAFSEN